MHLEGNPWSKGLVYLTFTQRASPELSAAETLYAVNTVWIMNDILFKIPCEINKGQELKGLSMCLWGLPSHTPWTEFSSGIFFFFYLLLIWKACRKFKTKPTKTAIKGCVVFWTKAILRAVSWISRAWISSLCCVCTCRLICLARLGVDAADFHAVDEKVDFMNNERITGITVSW